MRTPLALLTLLLASLSPLHAANTPNIVFIIADDLGWADVGFHGGKAPTPTLDRLAAGGIELTQHYVYPVCSPTRAALLSGRYATRFNVTTPQNPRAFRWDQLTLARALKSAGYDTALCGKWHLGSKADQGPQKFGFDHSYGSLAGGVGPWDHRYKVGEFSTTWHRDGKLIEEKGHVTDLITKEAVEWIASRGDRPFFLYVPFTAVHLPVKEPDEWVAKVPASISGAVARHYAASIMHLDDSVRRILAALESSGRTKDTLVVFTSDNGGSTAENAGQTYPPDDYPTGSLPGSNIPLRGEKGSVYEGGIRAATIASWPGKLAPGKFTGVACITDWMPTFCGLAHVKPEHDPKWDGFDLWPQLTRATPPQSRAIYRAAPGYRSRMVRDGDWKLVEHEKGGKLELYNIADDLSEKRDLASEQPQRVADLKSRLAALAKSDKDAAAND